MIFHLFIIHMYKGCKRKTNNANNASTCIRYTLDACFLTSPSMRTVSRMKQYTSTLEIPSRFRVSSKLCWPQLKEWDNKMIIISLEHFSLYGPEETHL